MNAQNSDSLSIPVSSHSFESDYRFYNGNASLLSVSPIKQFNRIQLGYDQQKGNYRLSQAAESARSFDFLTEGTRRFGSIAVSGHFRYKRHLADSVGNTLLYNPAGEQFQPYYFFAQKKGNWDRHQYDLKGSLSYSVPGSKLTPFAEVEYINGIATRSNDPRPSNSGFHLKGLFGMGVRFTEKQFAGLGFILGKEVNEYSITYKNDAYQQSNLYPEYNNFLIMGYGFYRSWRTNQSMYHTVKKKGLEGAYHGAFQFGEITISGQWELGKASYSRRATSITSAEIVYGSDEEENFGLRGRWNHRWTSFQARFLANYHSMLIRDFNPLLNGNNYVANLERFNFQPAIGLIRKNRIKAEFALDGWISNRYRADGNSDHAVNNQLVELSFTPSWFYYSGKKSVWRLEGIFGYRWPMSGEWIIPAAQQTMFTRQVVFPDFTYFNTNVGQLGGSINWQGSWKKNRIFSRVGFVEHRTRQMGRRQQLSLQLGLII